jgi:hypothetical protein
LTASPDRHRQAPCCGPPADTRGRTHERPGYILWHFVEDFFQTPVGAVPRIKTRLEPRDVIGTLKVRCGIHRNGYRIAPGLYGVGTPTDESPVLVTANYKLSFDHLRRHLDGRNAWIVVLETFGINVWCAAGKGTFSTDEVIRRVSAVGLKQLVRHRRLILPQLSATGVSAQAVKRHSGFEVVWGPIRAADLTSFLDSGLRAADGMRRVTFSILERLTLIPVELSHLIRYGVWICLAAFLLSGIGPSVFSFHAAWVRGALLLAACGMGILAGAVVVPALLPWIPGRAFSIKGAIIGGIGGLLVPVMGYPGPNLLEASALTILTLTTGSYLAMNFTGATPFTSPSGVEKEMRRAIPAQAFGLLLGIALWLAAAF